MDHTSEKADRQSFKRKPTQCDIERTDQFFCLQPFLTNGSLTVEANLSFRVHGVLACLDTPSHSLERFWCCVCDVLFHYVFLSLILTVFRLKTHFSNIFMITELYQSQFILHKLILVTIQLKARHGQENHT